MKKVTILGSTGSIGRQTLEVVAANRALFAVSALAAHQNDRLLLEQMEVFRPKLAILVDEAAAARLKASYRGPAKILAGRAGLLEAAAHPDAALVVNSLVGFAGLEPTLAAIAAGKDIALANKETLVAAGELVMRAARDQGVHILPVDSEHSAIFQCLKGERRDRVHKLIITASGGPFRGRTKAQLARVTVADCLKHPNWSMGRKITVDSATLANKGLEVIEAKWLYGVDYDQIEVVIQPQSIIHSMVEFVDGAVMAQLGRPDMRLPIQYALTYPERLPSAFGKLHFADLAGLTFERPDEETFIALPLAYRAGRAGGTAPCVFNAANETAVRAFLEGRLPFLAVGQVIEEAMRAHTAVEAPALADLYAADAWAREYAGRFLRTLRRT